ncbi:RagB/SusD family nutrient uptake outer membrane protein [Sphingobacterium sp. DR205]|uniref:RagB/SusD family nutrient uptake outer membrane protein n=1 Tax=Sphingobacterium sp. DR205 TaxID=2713573 RepID=UPI0013E487B2|nr:RagB/SusD family nutrient uptake outer membrane protein [Sphingobacterium sp. DR205]QIH35473.1 RagB/SusD family nutrient uptake outer membrane protein [Sphingobacterium sp. DR205]
MRVFTYIGLAAAMLSTASCKKYLSEEPKKQASIKTVDQLEALVDNATVFSREENYAATYATDDTEISKELYKNNVTAFTVDNLQRYVSSPEGIENLATDELWTGEYKKIFTANVILKNIDLVSGDEASRIRVKADAHFIRAMSYWTLVNNYCAPYTAANMNSLGLPLKRSVDYEESLKRATLKETYDFILADIQEAKNVAEADVDPRKAWRVSQKAISAFMSRYYLFTGDYDKSLAESNKALESGTVTLVDYNTLLPGRSVSYSNPAATLRYCELNDWNAAKYLYWSELYYSRFQYTGTQWYIPSSALVALYDQTNDLRYKHLMIPNGGRRFSVVTPAAYRYTMFTDGSTLVSGPTRAEMLLNKAEVLARKGDVQNALLTVNTLRQKRMSSYVALTANNKDEAIKQVLAERRRELPFVMRWYDIRRFSVNDYAADNITVRRDFYQVSTTGVDLNTPKTYTLESKHLVVPINGVEIDASKGQIQQNPY